MFVIVALRGSAAILQDTLSPSSVFAGLLALTGFLFTARTFITFKLNESVYCDKNYQKDWKEKKEKGAIKGELYTPLKAFDERIHRATLLCFVGLFVIFLFSLVQAFIGQNQKTIAEVLMSGGIKQLFTSTGITVLLHELFGWIVVSLVLAALLKTFFAFQKINQNIQDIIKIWERNHSDPCDHD